MKLYAAICALACGGLLVDGLPAGADTPQTSKSKSAAPAGAFAIKFTQHKLKNGLRVILSEDHHAPTISISVNYDVGSRDERKGRTGFAHLFEHMMFQGSEKVGKGEHFILVYNNGGGMNGTTNNDRTVYFETLPANQLDLALFLEADRMRSLVVNEENLKNQINAVQEERRIGIDNSPYGPTFEAIDETAYDNFAYKHSVIGSLADLSAASVQDVQEFFKAYYAPNNAVLVLVGDFQTPVALAKLRKYFGNIPAQKRPPPVDLTEPPQSAERRKHLDDGFARAPRLDMVFKIPASHTPDWYALDVAGDVLCRGQSSRLYQKLVREMRVATGVFCGPDGKRGPALFQVGVAMVPGAEFAAVEKLVYEDLEKLQKEAVPDAEIGKIRMQNRRSQVQSLQGTLGRAIQLSEYAVGFHDPGMVNTALANFNRVTAADIQRVAGTYWKETNRTVLTTSPKAKAGN